MPAHNNTEHQETLVWISVDDLKTLARLLGQAHMLASDESITHVQVAGEGNMNCTLRVMAVEKPRQ